MMEKLRALDLHYADVEARLSAPETYEDPALVARLNKEQRELEPVVTAYRAYERRKRDLTDAEALLSDPDMKELAQEEDTEAKADVARLEEEIRDTRQELQKKIRKKGEEASTKLLFPMILYLIIVMILVIYPAYQKLGGI